MGAFIRNMPAGMFYLILAFAIGAAIALIVVGRQARRRAALVQAMPTTNIGMAVDGYVEFEGRTEAVEGPPLLTPLTRQPCAWYHAQVRKDVGTRQQRERRRLDHDLRVDEAWRRSCCATGPVSAPCIRTAPTSRRPTSVLVLGQFYAWSLRATAHARRGGFRSRR